MGDILSMPSQPNPSSSSAPSMPPPTSPQSKPDAYENKTPIQESSDAQTTSIRENPGEKESHSKKDSGELKTPIEEPSNQTDTKTEEIGQGLAEKEIPTEKDLEEEDDDEDDEELGECGFCLFMKGGGCKDTFTEWETCVEEGERNSEDIVEKCFQATAALKKCMDAHSDYYAPLLQAEKAAEAEAVKQLEEEKQKLSNQEGGGGEELENKEKEESSNVPAKTEES